jgi:hypothetical protein
MTIDFGLVNSVILLLLSAIAAMAKAEIHDIKQRVKRIEDVFFDRSGNGSH